MVRLKVFLILDRSQWRPGRLDHDQPTLTQLGRREWGLRPRSDQTLRRVVKCPPCFRSHQESKGKGRFLWSFILAPRQDLCPVSFVIAWLTRICASWFWTSYFNKREDVSWDISGSSRATAMAHKSNPYKKAITALWVCGGYRPVDMQIEEEMLQNLSPASWTPDMMLNHATPCSVGNTYDCQCLENTIKYL